MKHSFVSGFCLAVAAMVVQAADPTMCGRDSPGGNVSCAFNVCCSNYGYCGTTEGHCTGCQQGFGGCNVIPAPSCAGQNTAASRTIGYYQGTSNNRSCNPVTPKDINTESLTHLNFAFAGIDPTTFQIVEGDKDLYQQFTALQNPNLETWIAIGGGDFSKPGPTQKTWSQMCSSKESRQSFIDSVVAFLDKYNFQGVDLDWEYPAFADRGGQPSDTANLVALVQELRDALGTDYGLSVILPPEYVTLQGYDIKCMEPYVDWFGFMSYDLHSSLDTDHKIRPQTDIRDIQYDASPLWFGGIDLGKVNFGLAYYGRGFTLNDTSCTSIGCAFSGPSNPTTCSREAGLMTLREIEELINTKGLKPELISDAMIKQITWDNQWIGYDDNQTIALKTDAASNLCFGGTMIWSVDLA